MKVLQVINGLDQGGAEMMVVDTAQRLQKAGVKSIVATIDAPSSGTYFFERALQSAGVEVLIPPRRAETFPLRVRDLLRVVRSARPDVVHAHLTRASMVARAVTSVTRTPLVTSLHSLSYEPEILRSYANPNSPKHQVARVLEGLATRVLDDSVIAVGNVVAESARRRLHVSARQLRVLVNPVDFERLDATVTKDRAALAEELGVPSSDTWLLMVGRVTELKAMHDAVLSLSPWGEGQGEGSHFCPRLFIAGSLADEPYVHTLRALISRHRLDSRVHLLGPRHDVTAWQRACDLFLFPSRYEGLPLALVEALGQGAEVIVSDIPSNLEVVEPGVTGHVFRAGDASGLTALLRSRTPLVLDAAERKRRTRARFAPGPATAALIELYRSVS